MTRPLVFMMGRSPAILPTDRYYTPGHMWAVETTGGWRFGFSAYAVRLLGQVQQLRWYQSPGAAVRQGDELGFVEGSKATSDLYCPASGTLVETNPDVVADPSLINSHLYDRGWLVTIATDSEQFLSPQEYLTHLEACWPLAQQLLKRQAGHR